MLTKKVCIKCINNSKEHGYKGWNEDHKFSDDESWDKGTITCPLPLEYQDYREECKTNISDTPPHWCPYKFEHAVGDTK